MIFMFAESTCFMFFDWFLERQLMIMAIIGLICSVIMFAIGSNGVSIVIQTLICLVIAFVGGRIYEGETSETWLQTSWLSYIRAVLGSLVLGFAWLCFIGGGRGGVGVVVQTIASIFLKLG